jgi:hypothetical protein
VAALPGHRVQVHLFKEDLERHSLDGLAVALEYVDEYVDGTVNNRIAARELDLSPLEAEIILQALEPVAKAYAETAALRRVTLPLLVSSFGVVTRTDTSFSAFVERSNRQAG